MYRLLHFILVTVFVACENSQPSAELIDPSVTVRQRGS